MNKYEKDLISILQNMKEVPECLKASSPSKISIHANHAFSLPPGSRFSCVGATKACEKCYGTRGRHVFGPVKKNLIRNYYLLKKLSKYRIIKMIDSLLHIIPKNVEIFRIHENGDFYSQKYVNAWAGVIRQRRDVKFWAYTRSFDFDYSQLTRNPNFTLWASTDDYNWKRAKEFVRRYRKSGTKHAYGPWNRCRETPSDSFVCPATNGKVDIVGACEKCLLCVVKKRSKKNVVFLEH